MILFGESGFLLVQRLRLTVNLANPADTTNTVQSMQDFAKMLFGQYLLPFEVTSIILLVAMIGAIVMSKKMKGEEA